MSKRNRLRAFKKALRERHERAEAEVLAHVNDPKTRPLLEATLRGRFGLSRWQARLVAGVMLTFQRRFASSPLFGVDDARWDP